MYQSKSSKRRTILSTLETYKDIGEPHIRKSKIREIFENPDHYELGMAICRKKMGQHLTKNNADIICKCLTDKNGNLTVDELETAVANKQETPASSCITTYDTLVRSQQHNHATIKKTNTPLQSKSNSKSRRNSTKITSIKRHRNSKKSGKNNN